MKSAVSAKKMSSPASLKEGTTANDRRVIVGETGVVAAPVNPDDGWATHNAGHVHIVVEVLDGTGKSIDWSLWLYSSFTRKWCLDTRLGTAGVVTLDGGDTDNPQLKILEIAGVDRVAIQLANPVGLVNGVDVHIGGNTYV